MKRTVMITGGFGFIGSNLVNYWLENYPSDRVVIVDSITYAAHPKFQKIEFHPNLRAEIVDIRDQAIVAKVLARHRPQMIFHLAAESHVCRSISGPKDFMTTNVMGTWNLLEEWRSLHQSDISKPFVHVSTDEVFGELEDHDPPFNEESPIRPRSPYASSKASSDLIALSYYETYNMPVRVTNCSNNYGPYQHSEKLIPATVARFLSDEPARIYGAGNQIRDWLYANDHCRALDLVASRGLSGERYCIGGGTEMTNLTVVEMVHRVLVEMAAVSPESFHVEHDEHARPTDDYRYAIDNSKIKSLGWSPNPSLFYKNLKNTVAWLVEQELELVCEI